MILYTMSHRRGKRRYKFKIIIRASRRVDFGARMPDDQIAALDKLLHKVLRTVLR